MTRQSSSCGASTVIDFPQATNPKEDKTLQAPKALRGPQFLQEVTFQSPQIKKLSPRLKELVAMLEYARPEGTETEEHFISTYLDTLPGMTQDAYGNRICKVGREKPTVAWSSHTDTVHYDEGIQAIEIDKHGLIGLDFNSDANCLGADCTAGVWLMRRLIMAGKPGLYIFHRGEESGGQGSRWIASNTPELVDGIEAMIALDRYGYSSVITEQSTGVTASTKFAQSLADQLNAFSGFQGQYKPDDSGIFTDSAFYNHLIPECTNISVGYFSQHGRKESLDYAFTDDLLLSLLKLDYSRLTIARDPKADPEPWDRRWSYYYRGTDYDGDMDKYHREQWGDTSTQGEHVDHDLVDLIRRNPEAAARLLGYWDVSVDDMYEAIADYENEMQRDK
jgi:hypothetical protein